MNQSIEQYCDAIASGELNADSSSGSTWGIIRSNQTNAPKDINHEVCIYIINCCMNEPSYFSDFYVSLALNYAILNMPCQRLTTCTRLLTSPHYQRP